MTLAEIDTELARLTAMRDRAEDACHSGEEDYLEDRIDRLLAERWAETQQAAEGWAAT